MGLDIRVPLGLIFLITGGILSAYGFFTRHSTIYAKSMGVNLNLWWGLAMMIFGALMFYFGRQQKWQDDPVTPRPWERSSKLRR